MAEVEALSVEQVHAQSWLSDQLKKVGVPEVNLAKNPAAVIGIVAPVLAPVLAPVVNAPSNSTVVSTVEAAIVDGVKLEVAKKAFSVLDTDTLKVLATAISQIVADRGK